MSYERTTKDSVEYIANKFAENPGHFAATILRMYWDMEKQCDQYKAEHDSLIDDIAVLKANNDRYRNRAENAMEYAERSQCEVLRLERENKSLKHENKALLSQSNSYFDEWQNERTTSRGLREQCKEYAKDTSKYLYLTGHIRMKAEVNPSVDRYIDLVHYIDKLEGGENEV